MNELIAGAVFFGGLYALVKWNSSTEVEAVHRKIMKWSNDSAKIKHFTSHDSFDEWIKALPDAALNSKDALAIEALVSANLPPIGIRGSEPLSRLGATLHSSWADWIETERTRRMEAKEIQ